MILVKICLIWLSIQEKAFLTDAGFKFYTSEGSTMNFNFTANITQTYIGYYGKRSDDSYNKDYQRVKTNRYDIVLRPNVLEFQIINVTASDEGLYWFDFDWNRKYRFQLKITNNSCQSHAPYYVCVINGTSAVITLTSTEASFLYTPGEEWHYWKYKRRILSNATIHMDLYIYNVTLEDEGVYHFHNRMKPIKLQVSKLWFTNQTHLKTIVGHEGEEITMICSSDTGEYITSLILESNGIVRAIGDHQNVSYSFIPDRTDHLEKFKCVDSNHSSIMIEVELIIRYAPSVIVRYTNGTIECDCDGFPPVYSVYRLDRISKYGKLVYSKNLDNEIFIFNTDQFPYQRNGRYMCVVSNGIPDTSGKELQNSSILVNYEGPPVFATENRYVKIGKARESSVTISFHVYSCPDVEEIFLEKIGRLRGQKRKIDEYVLKPTLLHNELDKTTGVPGFDILIESDELYIDDLQPFCITVTNRLGTSEYHFAITKTEHHEINKKERTYVFTICVLGVVLFSWIIVYVGDCVRRVRLRISIHSNVNEDHTYHTYDEIGTISYGAVSNVRPTETHDNQDQILAHLHEAHISNEVNMQSPDSNSAELNTDSPNENLQQRGVTGIQEQAMSLPTDDTDSIDNKEQTSDRKSRNSNDSDSESSQTVMVGNVGDGYENPYQTVLLDRPEGHQYTQITIERNTSIVSADLDCEMQLLEHSLTKEAGYINLKF